MIKEKVYEFLLKKLNPTSEGIDIEDKIDEELEGFLKNYAPGDIFFRYVD